MGQSIKNEDGAPVAVQGYKRESSAKWNLRVEGWCGGGRGKSTKILYDIILSLDIHDGDWQLILVSMI